MNESQTLRITLQGTDYQRHTPGFLCNCQCLVCMCVLLFCYTVGCVLAFTAQMRRTF